MSLSVRLKCVGEVWSRPGEATLDEPREVGPELVCGHGMHTRRKISVDGRRHLQWGGEPGGETALDLFCSRMTVRQVQVEGDLCLQYGAVCWKRMHDAGALQPLEAVQISGEMPLGWGNQDGSFARQQIPDDRVSIVVAKQADVAVRVARRMHHSPAVAAYLDHRTVAQRGVERSEKRCRVGVTNDGSTCGLCEVPRA